MSFEFDGLCLLLHRRELLRNHERIPLARLPLELLAYLIRNRGRVVTKEELVRVGWRTHDVSDEAIARVIADVRRAIGDSGSAQRLIRTKRSEGYQFIANVIEHSTLPRVREEIS